MKRNNKGFTLIELLAVIVILGVILALAIPAVAQYINSAKKSTYVDNAQAYASAARNELFLNDSDYALPVNTNDATAISFKNLVSALESGGKKSPYGGEFVDEYSFVIIKNIGTAEKPKYNYYIAALDSKGYGISSGEGTAQAVLYDELSEKNIRQLGGTGITVSGAATNLGVNITYNYTSSANSASSSNGE